MGQRLGQWGEERAAAFLINKGYELLDTNWRSRPGEIDLVMKDGEEIVFVEVKTRRGLGFGYPEEAINDKKIASLVEVCEKYINEKGIDLDWRLDVVAVIGDEKTGAQNIEHIQGLEI